MMKKHLLALLLIPLILPSAYAESNVNTATAQSRVMTDGLNHLGLSVTKLSASTEFFTHTLGWREVGGYPDYPSRFVTDGKVFITLWQTNDPKQSIAFDRKNNVGLHHLALTVSSAKHLETLHQRFKLVKGLVIEFAPELNGKGPTMHMMIREPSGNRIEFTHTPK
jgi:lactoylglutathione lyase